MLKIGIIKEGKKIPDSRVPLTPKQCRKILNDYNNIEIFVQPSPTRSYTDQEYIAENITLQEDLSNCDILLGVKEVPIDQLIPNKTYFFFSHTKKKQPYNQDLMHALIQKHIKMIDYEALTYDDGSRIIGFGFFAGVVGAHNGLRTYGKKTKQYNLIPAHECHDKNEMLQQYNNVKLPPMKIVVTGSGKVTAGILDILSHWDIQSVEPQDFLQNEYSYPVYTLLKGASLYQHKVTKEYFRKDFHEHPENYNCIFKPYTAQADILMNGIYWDEKIEKLFESKDIENADFKISVMADITCDPYGSVPINVGASTIPEPVYGIDRNTKEKVAPHISSNHTIDVMAVDNLPNELPRDAAYHFGEHIIKYIIPELLAAESKVLDRATICKDGKLTADFAYLADYAYA